MGVRRVTGLHHPSTEYLVGMIFCVSRLHWCRVGASIISVPHSYASRWAGSTESFFLGDSIIRHGGVHIAGALELSGGHLARTGGSITSLVQHNGMVVVPAR